MGPGGQPCTLAQGGRVPATLGSGVGREAAGFGPATPSCALRGQRKCSLGAICSWHQPETILGS